MFVAIGMVYAREIIGTDMDSVEDYARQCAKREKEDLDNLSEWVKSVRPLIQIRIKKLV
jgi:flavin-binding protein dodecin